MIHPMDCSWHRPGFGRPRPWSVVLRPGDDDAVPGGLGHRCGPARPTALCRSTWVSGHELLEERLEVGERRLEPRLGTDHQRLFAQ